MFESKCGHDLGEIAAVSDSENHDAWLNDLESEWRLKREAALIAERQYQIVAQRLREEANRFEVVKERFEIAQILESRSLMKLKSYQEQQENKQAPAK